MRKLSARAARVAIAAGAIVLVGGFATYAAAQVTTKPAPQVVIPRSPTTDDHGARKSGADDPAGHDANKVGTTAVSDDPAGHNANRVGTTVVSDDPAGHDANDDKGGATVVSDDSPGHDANDDKGGNAVTPTTSSGSTTPTSVDDHGGNRSGRSGSGGHGSDG
jgi:hypothetical protein